MNFLNFSLSPHSKHVITTLAGQPDISLPAAYLSVPRKHEALRTAYQVLLALPATSTGIEKSWRSSSPSWEQRWAKKDLKRSCSMP